MIKKINNKDVFFTVNTNRKVTYHKNVDFSIKTISSINLDSGFRITIDIDSDITLFAPHLLDTFLKVINVKFLDRLFNANEADRPYTTGIMYIKFSKREEIKSIALSKAATIINAVDNIKFENYFPNLLEFQTVFGKNTNLSNEQDMNLIPNLVKWTGGYTGKQSELPSLKYLYGSVYVADFNVYPYLSLQFAEFRANGIFDLSTYFTNTNRRGVGVIIAFAGSVIGAKYSGGGIFAPNIDEDTLFKLPYIFFQQTTPETVPLTGDELSQFLIDFANQVKTVTISNKKMTFATTAVPNTSYTDLSQPLYTTYSAAFNYITTTLGITVTF